MVLPLCAKNIMSNKSIKKYIEKSIEEFRSGKISVKSLKESIELNGRALEMLPYSMIKALDDFEYKLTLSQFADEEDSYPTTKQVLSQIEEWLTKVPVEND